MSFHQDAHEQEKVYKDAVEDKSVKQVKKCKEVVHSCTAQLYIKTNAKCEYSYEIEMKEAMKYHTGMSAGLL